MFILVAGHHSTAHAEIVEVMARHVRGAPGLPTVWRNPDGDGGAAALVPGLLPEDSFDRQPLVTKDRVLVCQVRLDNRNDLLARLDDAPHERSSTADSTLLSMAYDRWGEACLERMSGDFAFVVWHRREDRIVAAVDPFGARRLFWSQTSGGLVISAQMAALLAHPEISSAPDLQALGRLFDMGIDRASTPFERVHALPGGHRLEWRRGEVRVSSWWHPQTTPAIRYRDPNDYVLHAQELFGAAVAAQLRATGSISSTLSGGLDSGLVTTTAARQLRSRGQRLTAYTSVPSPRLARVERPGWETDDGPYAAEVALFHDNVDHRFVSAAGRCTLDLLPRFHAQARTPTRSVTNFLWLDAISAAQHSHASRVLLVGQKGNGTFSWRGDDALGELVAGGRLKTALHQAYLEAEANNRSVMRVLAAAIRSRARTALPSFTPSMTSPGYAFLRPRWRPSSGLRGGAFALMPGTRAYWIAFATTPNNAWWPDPTAQWGTDWRDPTADRWLVEHLLRFPQYAFRTGGRERGLARTMARGLMPDRVRLRRTQGAQVPEVASLIALHAHRYVQALERMSRSAACRELFDLASVRTALESIAGGLLDGPLSNVLDRAFDVGLFLCRLEDRQ